MGLILTHIHVSVVDYAELQMLRAAYRLFEQTGPKVYEINLKCFNNGAVVVVNAYAYAPAKH